jgi:hypothetical protein
MYLNSRRTLKGGTAMAAAVAAVMAVAVAMVMAAAAQEWVVVAQGVVRVGDCMCRHLVSAAAAEVSTI